MLWPPPLTLSSSPWSRANPTAAATSRADVGWTTSAGALATMPFHIRTASSQPSSPGRSSGPSRRASRSSSCFGVRLTRPAVKASDVDGARVHVAGPPSGRGFERLAERLQECLRLFDGRIVAGILDHVQRPSVAGARGLGDRQLRREVVAAPDQGRGNGDPRQLRRRDRGHPEQLHEAALSGLRSSACGHDRGCTP